MRYIELSVGTFMVMGIIALVLMAFRVSGLSMDTGGETYTLKARFQNLGGLTERSSPPTCRPMYFSPSRPAVRIAALVSVLRVSMD